jgi:hypothetical protein
MQLEFPVFVQEAEFASQALADQSREKRRVQRAQRNTLGKSSSPSFDKSWLAAVTARIKYSSTLREGIILTSTRMSELLDLELECEGHPQHWQEKYDVVCDAQARYYAGLEDEPAKIVAQIWARCRDLFRLYYAIHSMSDWDLYETLCSGGAAFPAEAGPESAKAQCLQNHSDLVVSLHFLVTVYGPGKRNNPAGL